MELINKLHAFTTSETYWPGINLDDKFHQRTKTQSLNRIAAIIIFKLFTKPHRTYISHYWQQTHFYEIQGKVSIKNLHG